LIRRNLPNGKCSLYQSGVGKRLRIVAEPAAGRRVDLLAIKAERPTEVDQILKQCGRVIGGTGSS